MVYDGILLSIIIGFLRKGSLKGFTSLKFRYGWVFPILLLLEVIVFMFEDKINMIGSMSNLFFMIIYVVGLFFIVVNRDKYGFSLIFIGVFLNCLVMVVNGGRMPVSEEAAKVLDPAFIETLKMGLYGKHTLLTESTHLPFLGDIIPLSKPYPRQQVISIGDVVMNLGIFLFIQDLMIKSKLTKSSTSISTPYKGGDVNV